MVRDIYIVEFYSNCPGDFTAECSVHGLTERQFCPCFTEDDIEEFCDQYDEVDYDFEELRDECIHLKFDLKDKVVFLHGRAEPEDAELLKILREQKRKEDLYNDSVVKL